MKKQIIYSIVALFILFGGLFVVYKLIGSGEIDEKTQKEIMLHIKGRTTWNTKAPHTLTIFSDFECPACKTFDEYLHSLESSKTGGAVVPKKTAFVFRYFPLYQIHEHAFSLAYAAEAAARQDKFFPMTKRFFADQEQFAGMKDIQPYLTSVAKELSLDLERFKKDMDDPALQKIVQDELSLGDKVGINATPTFFLDGKKLDSLAPVDLLTILKGL